MRKEKLSTKESDRGGDAKKEKGETSAGRWVGKPVGPVQQQVTEVGGEQVTGDQPPKEVQISFAQVIVVLTFEVKSSLTGLHFSDIEQGNFSSFAERTCICVNFA